MSCGGDQGCRVGLPCRCLCQSFLVPVYAFDDELSMCLVSFSNLLGSCKSMARWSEEDLLHLPFLQHGDDWRKDLSGERGEHVQERPRETRGRDGEVMEEKHSRYSLDERKTTHASPWQHRYDANEGFPQESSSFKPTEFSPSRLLANDYGRRNGKKLWMTWAAKISVSRNLIGRRGRVSMRERKGEEKAWRWAHTRPLFERGGC